jgi:hypothetical protein
MNPDKTLMNNKISINIMIIIKKNIWMLHNPIQMKVELFLKIKIKIKGELSLKIE